MRYLKASKAHGQRRPSQPTLLLACRTALGPERVPARPVVAKSKGKPTTAASNPCVMSRLKGRAKKLNWLAYIEIIGTSLMSLFLAMVRHSLLYYVQNIAQYGQYTNVLQGQ